MFGWFREQKLDVETNKRAMPKSKIYKTRIEIPSTANSLSNGLLCHLAPTDQWEMREVETKSESKCFGKNINGE